ncbi:MarR family winged helix-turn-helix transcriptional regulator [Rhodoglobus sp.]
MDTQQPISYWVKHVDRIIDELFALTLEEHGITRRQWQLLVVLSKGPAGVALLDIEIAPFLNSPRAAVPPTQDAHTSSLESLQELVESEWLTTDGSLYELTERGRGVVERLAAVIAKERTKATAGVTPEQYETAITVLETMAKNLSTQRDGAAPPAS